MCKFNNRLFVFALLLLSTAARSAPTLQREENGLPILELLSTDDIDNDYDLRYDQRQKGNENFRLNLNGFFIGMPTQDSSALMLLTEDLLENFGDDLLLGLGKSQNANGGVNENSMNFKTAKVESNNNKQTLEAQKAETIVVEIPAPKKEVEGRNSISRGEQLEEVASGSRTKQQLLHLLSLLRRTRRN